jgi:3-phenylpropionate/cinnamic acid dioxygenase small subunit
VNARDRIERVLYEYCAGIDRGDFAATAALFGAAGLYGLVGAGAARGSEQVLHLLQSSVRTYDGVPRTRHILTNVCIDVHDDEMTADARSYLQVVHQAPDGPLTPIVAGTYIDRLHVIDGEWQFAERRMQLELLGDLSTHLHDGFL